jgi:hypothetical protein
MKIYEIKRCKDQTLIPNALTEGCRLVYATTSHAGYFIWRRIAWISSAYKNIDIKILCLCLPFLFSAGGARADDFLISTSLYTTHFAGNTGLNNHQHLLGIEYQTDENWVFGISEFKNSYNQQTEFIYAGKRWHPFDMAPHFHIKLTAGAIHGYKGEHSNVIPMNGSGTAPAIIPGIGLDYPHFNIEALTFYKGMMVISGVRF